MTQDETTTTELVPTLSQPTVAGLPMGAVDTQDTGNVPNQGLSVPTEEPKPRRKRRRKEVTVDKFIIVRVTQEMYDKVQRGADLSEETLSAWVRRALEAKLS